MLGGYGWLEAEWASGEYVPVLALPGHGLPVSCMVASQGCTGRRADIKTVQSGELLGGPWAVSPAGEIGASLGVFWVGISWGHFIGVAWDGWMQCRVFLGWDLTGVM